MNIDDQLRDVYAGLASQAPNGDRVRAGIAGRIKAHRQRRLLLGAGGTAAALTALGVPALLWLRKDPSTVDALLGLVPGRGYPMPFTPSWIPDGYRLTERRVTTGVAGPQRRVWQSNPPNTFPEIKLDLTLLGADPLPSSSTVDINDVPGWLNQGEYSASCSWEPLPGVQVRVSLFNQPDDTYRGAEYAEIVLRIARSAGVSKVEYLRPTMSFGWLPDQVPLRRTFETFDESDFRAEGVMAYASQSYPVIWVGAADKLKDSTSLADAEKTTLRGRPAWYSPPHPQAQDPHPGSFVVELANGKWLSAGGNPKAGGITLTKADLVRIVETFQIGVG